MIVKICMSVFLLLSLKCLNHFAQLFAHHSLMFKFTLNVVTDAANYVC